MPDINIIKLKIRRGTDAQRKQVALEQGELGYTIDTKRVYVGDGATAGGNLVGNVVFSPTTVANNRLNISQAQKGDLVYDNNAFFQLTGNSYGSAASWARLSPGIDTSHLEYDSNNILKIKQGGITSAFINANLVNVSTGLSSTAAGISINYNTEDFQIETGNKFSLKPLSSNNINSQALGAGLSGGDGKLLGVKADPAQFMFDATGNMQLRRIPDNFIDGSMLSASSIGEGLIVTSNKLQVNYNDIIQTGQGLAAYSEGIGLQTFTLPQLSSNFVNFYVDNFGRVTNRSNVITTTLTGNSTPATAGALFNGHLNTFRYTNQTILTSISGEGATSRQLLLTSAGFMVINTDSNGAIAVPVFRLRTDTTSI